MTHRLPELSDVGWLQREYIVAGKTTIEIAASLGCNQSAVCKALHRHGIPVRSTGHQTTEPDPAGPEPPRFPSGFSTHKCVKCHSLTSHYTCLRCGGQTEKVVIFNADLGDVGAAWGLSTRESEVVALMTEGLTTFEMAAALGMSEKVIKGLFTQARQKMGLGVGSGNRLRVAHMWWDAQQEALERAANK